MDLKLYCVFSKMLSNSSKLGMKKIHFTKYWDHSKFLFRFQDIWVFKLFGKKTFFLKIRNKWWFFSNFLYFRKNKVHMGISTRKKTFECVFYYMSFSILFFLENLKTTFSVVRKSVSKMMWNMGETVKFKVHREIANQKK